MIQAEINRRGALQRVAFLLGGILSVELTAGLRGEILYLGKKADVTPNQTALLAEVADVIIPTTDTPGAKAAGVEKFIIRVMRDCYRYEEQEQFYAGLKRLEEDCQKRFGKPFAQLDAEQKNTTVKHCADHDRSFFSRIKQLTIAGYFTSEIGATKALEYLPIPGRFEGSVPLKPGQKAWAV
jgi:hypothetical protein